MKPPKPTCQQQLEALQQEFDEFAYIVTHDLKAPLRAIGNLSGWIREDLGEALDPDVKHNMDLLQNRAERLERMINGLWLYARSTRSDMDVKEVQTAELVQTIAATLQQEIVFTLNLGELPVLYTYAQKLETVFEQLLKNAVQFNDHTSPHVWVEAYTREEEIEFSIKDNGPGISEESLDKIFKIFYTVHPKDQQESVGIGLALAKKIVHFLGGSIFVESSKGKGTLVRFTWPLVSQEPAAKQEKKES